MGLTMQGQAAIGPVTALELLAEALSAHPHIKTMPGRSGRALCLWVGNRAAADVLSETVAVGRIGSELVYIWLWGEQITPVARAQGAARCIVCVLSARDAQLDQ